MVIVIFHFKQALLSFYEVKLGLSLVIDNLVLEAGFNALFTAIHAACAFSRLVFKT
ncbi:MAG: hypothetical protein ACTSWN_10620 [Promethearchaeota archaeon]